MNMFAYFIRKKYWIYIFPWLMDFSLASIALFATVKAIQLHATSLQLGILGSLWGITYFLSSMLITKFASRNNAEKFMLFSCISIIVIATSLAFLNFLSAIFILFALCGFVLSYFFVGFQLFMGEITRIPERKRTAFYTLAWSSGIAFGSLTMGILVAHGPFTALLPVIISSLLVIAGIQLLKRLKSNQADIPPEDEQTEIAISLSSQATQKYVFIGWTGMFAVNFISSGIRFLLPKIGIEYFRFSLASVGTALFGILFLQAITGFFLLYAPKWKHRFTPHIFFKVIAIIGCLSPIFLNPALGLSLFVILIGIYSGHAFYNGVFYSLSQYHKSARNISINETLVGISSVLGPLFFGILVKQKSALFFVAPIIILVLAFSLQICVLSTCKPK